LRKKIAARKAEGDVDVGGGEASGSLLFNGRVQKIVSLVASLASARFNFYLMQVTVVNLRC
jgi:hypothetical protein